jgi:hypothetical protein
MAMKCPQCGAKNDDGVRRCRVCANLLNASVPEVEHRPPDLPEHVQRRIEEAVAPHTLGDTNIPGPTTGGFGSLPPRPVGEAPLFDPNALYEDIETSEQFQHLPPPPAPPQPDLLEMPPEPERPDLLKEIQLGPNATTEEIERAAAEALRQEPLARRPGFLKKVLKEDD